jgi:putative transposase
MSGKIGEKIWQRNYCEHIIRNEKDLYHIRQYIQNNILKWEVDSFYPKN